MNNILKVDHNQLLAFCRQQVENDQLSNWLFEKCQSSDDARSFFVNFGLIGRKVPRKPIDWDKKIEETLRSVNPPFDRTSWTLDDLCRLSLLLSLDPAHNKGIISTLLSAADMREQVIIYKSLAFLSNAADFNLMAIDGIRTNMVDVFDAIALNNIYPFRYFSEDAWNQMVIKAIFMERPIFKIAGLDERKNQKLADILYDFIHERWSASRQVTPELWRLLSGYVNDLIFADLQVVLSKDNPLAKEAATKVLEETNAAKRQWLEDQGIAGSEHTWDEIGKLIFEKK